MVSETAPSISGSVTKTPWNWKQKIVTLVILASLYSLTFLFNKAIQTLAQGGDSPSPTVTTARPPLILPTNISNCGGILISHNGWINYSQPASLLNVRCTWTIRVGKSSKINFNLQAIDLGKDSYLALSPLKGMLLEESDAGLILNDSSKGNYELDGPVVFATLWVGKDRAAASFLLGWEESPSKGEEEESEFDNVTFTHNEFKTKDGSLGGGAKYRPNEIATFTINPVPFSTPDLYLTGLEIEECSKETLNIFKWDPFFVRIGRREDFKLCGKEEGLDELIAKNFDSAVVIYRNWNTDNKSKGFSLRWG